MQEILIIFAYEIFLQSDLWLPVKQLLMKSEQMYVRETYTLLVNFFHNMDPKQIIYARLNK